MKIGILTYHRAENYGALLQAYGLKIYLSSLGHDVSFVDYWPEYHQKYHKILRMDKILYGSLKEKLVSIYNVLFWGMFRYRRRRNLQRFMHEHLGLTQNPLYSKDNDIVKGYDCVVYGSDQIWRKQSQISDIGFNSWYFGSDNIITPVKIAYAASMGQILCSEDDHSYLIKYLGGFSHLSVREQDLKEKLNTLGFHPELVCDPVFLLPKEEWRKIFSPQEYKEKYILVYNLLENKETVVLAEKIHQQTGLPIKEINIRFGIRHLGKRYIRIAKVDDFLSLIDNAEYVVSNSFHGVAFSLIFEKNFFAIGMEEKSSRVISLLNIAGLDDRYLSSVDKLNLNRSINFQLIRKKMDPFIQKSKDYLLSSLKL